VLLLGPPNIPHTSKLATIAADALTLAEAVFAGLVVGALVEAAWARVHLPGSGPADYLPVRWARRRIARRRLMALHPGMDGGGGRSGRIPRLCAEVGRRTGKTELPELDDAYGELYIKLAQAAAAPADQRKLFQRAQASYQRVVQSGAGALAQRATAALTEIDAQVKAIEP